MQSGKITALEIQKKNKERVNVYLDGEFAFGLPLMEAATLHKGQVLTPTDIAELRHKDAIQKAFDRAVRFLGYRPRSTDEVRRNLLKNSVTEPVAEATIERLIRLGYLDDHAFARFWLENRDTFNPRGTRALRYELRQKGVNDSVIDNVLDDFDSTDAAYRAAQSRIRKMQGSTRYDFRNKVGSYLQRRGFAYPIARDVIERLIEDIALDDPDYFAEDHQG